MNNWTLCNMLNWMERGVLGVAGNKWNDRGSLIIILFANIMTTAALETGLKSTFDEKASNVLGGDKVFKL